MTAFKMLHGGGRFGLIFCLLIGLFASLARAEGNAGFAGLFAFAPQAPGGDSRAMSRDQAPSDLDQDGICLSAIREAEARHDIPANLLLAVGLQEAGIERDGQTTIWPWSVNSEGQGYHFKSRAAAMRFVESEQAAGKSSIDIGCLQVNLRWHPKAFSTLEQGFDPRKNVDYAARFLSALYRETGDWRVAIGNYHSRTPAHHAKYLAGVDANLAYLSASPAPLRARDSDIDALDAALGEFARGDAPHAPRRSLSAAWGNHDSESLSIYSSQALRPVLAGFSGAPDA